MSKLIKLVDKQTSLQEFAGKYIAQQWQQELIAIDQRYTQNKQNIANGLITAFDTACKNALILQEQGKKGDIQYIYISFLRTSIMDNTSHYRIDAYDQNWYLDQQESFALWDADFIFRSLFSLMDRLKAQKAELAREYAGNITVMDIDRIKLLEALKYHLLAVEFIREMLPGLMESAGYKQMGKTPDISIMAGEYMDQSEILYGKNQESDKGSKNGTEG